MLYPTYWSAPSILDHGRDRTILRWYSPPPVLTGGLPHIDFINEIRLVEIWDADQDRRLDAILAAAWLRSRSALEQLLAVREERGKIAFWAREGADLKTVQAAMDDAAAHSISDRWRATPGAHLPCKNGLLDWTALPENDPTLGLIRTAAKAHALGFHDKAARRNGGAK
jgi:hypothetical protein